MSWLLHLFARRSERNRAPIWLWPSVTATVAFASALVLVSAGPSPLPRGAFLWPGGADAAVAVLQTIAASVITVTSLTFTLTVVALQLASQQFSPRLLREFTRDPVTKVVLSVLVGTFVFVVTALWRLDPESRFPNFGVLVAFVLGFVALAAVLGFITHIARILRVDTMMLAVHDETDRVISTFYPRYDDPAARRRAGAGVGGGSESAVLATSSGFVRTINAGSLVSAATEADVTIRVLVSGGDHVVRGTPIATVVRRDADVDGQLPHAIRNSVLLGYERTFEQDAALGFRQLEDIAVRALSPAINDPVTAGHAVGHMADLLVDLAERQLGPTTHDDDRGVTRVVLAGRDFRYFLDLACSQARSYGSRDATFLGALLRLLRDVATAARDNQQRSEIARQVALIRAAVPASMLPEDRRQVETRAQLVARALRGDIVGAFDDSSGETRSL